MEYGTGAVMSVPAHDERDFEFAQKFGLAVKRVTEPQRRGDAEEIQPQINADGRGSESAITEPFADYGVMVDSGVWTGRRATKAGRNGGFCKRKWIGETATTFRIVTGEYRGRGFGCADPDYLLRQVRYCSCKQRICRSSSGERRLQCRANRR